MNTAIVQILAEIRSVLGDGAVSDVTTIILRQLGGTGRIRAMLGAKFIGAIPDGVEIRWPAKERSKGNQVEIVLDQGSDTYRMTFYNVGKGAKKLVKAFDGLHAEDLIKTFEAQTGWYLKMGAEAPVEAPLAEMASPKSRKLLWTALQTIQANGELKLKLPKTMNDLGNETYGKQSMIYVTWESPADRKKGETELSKQGFKVRPDYDPGSARSEIQVSYFKGFHWDESTTPLRQCIEALTNLLEAEDSTTTPEHLADLPLPFYLYRSDSRKEEWFLAKARAKNGNLKGMLTVAYREVRPKYGEREQSKTRPDKAVNYSLQTDPFSWVAFPWAEISEKDLPSDVLLRFQGKNLSLFGVPK